MGPGRGCSQTFRTLLFPINGIRERRPLKNGYSTFLINLSIEIFLFKALGESTARATVLDQELIKAQKIIHKSKKVTEVQGLVRDNESLQRKLVSQEEDFRIQNQTLLDELSKVRI